MWSPKPSVLWSHTPVAPLAVSKYVKEFYKLCCELCVVDGNIEGFSFVLSYVYWTVHHLDS